MTACAIDLHLHSTASDGRLAPAELVAYAAARGVRGLALTDHDTVAGQAEFAAAVAAAGLAAVTGVELSATWRARSIHVLGYDFDPQDPGLGEAIGGLGSARIRRAEQIAARLDKARAPGREALAACLAATPYPTRTHFARALVELGAARDVQAAFERWLARGAAAYVAGDWLPLETAVQLLVAAGGVAVIAHPHRYPLSNGARRELGHDFRAAGGLGVEVATGGASSAQRDTCLSLAVRCGLDGSAGSDFHDPGMPWNPPGRLAKLPASVRPVWRHFRAHGGAFEQA